MRCDLKTERLVFSSPAGGSFEHSQRGSGLVVMDLNLARVRDECSVGRRRWLAWRRQAHTRRPPRLVCSRKEPGRGSPRHLGWPSSVVEPSLRATKASWIVWRTNSTWVRESHLLASARSHKVSVSSTLAKPWTADVSMFATMCDPCGGTH